MREKENQADCVVLSLLSVAFVKPCSGLRADIFPLRCPAAFRLVRRFYGTQNLYLLPEYVQALASYRHSFSDVDHAPNSRFSHTVITGSGMTA